MFRSNKTEKQKIEERSQFILNTKNLYDLLSMNKDTLQILCQQNAPANDAYIKSAEELSAKLSLALQSTVSTIPTSSREKIPAPLEMHIISFLGGKDYVKAIRTAQNWKMSDQQELNFWRKKLEEEFYCAPERTALLGNPEHKHLDHPKIVYKRLTKLSNHRFQEKFFKLSSDHSDEPNIAKFCLLTERDCPPVYQNQIIG